MKCNFCGHEAEENFAFCPICGKSAADLPEPGAVPSSSPITAMMKDTLFLVICILMSVSTVFGYIGRSLPIIGTFATIFLWIGYVRMATNGVPDVKAMKWLSGTIFAEYIVNWVIVGLIVFVGLFSSAALGYVSNNYWMFEGYFDDMSEIVFDIISATAGIVFVFMLFIAAIVAVFNIFSTRSFHKLAKSMYESVESGTLELKLLGRARAWMMAIGVLSGIGALMMIRSGGAVAFFNIGCSAAAYIVAYVLLNRYLNGLKK